MKNWSIGELKANAKVRFKMNYWKCVLIGLVVTLLGVGLLGISGAASLGDSARIANMRGVLNFGFGGEGISSSQKIAFGIVLVLALLTLFVLVFLIHVLLFNPLEVGCKRFFTRSLFENADAKEVCYIYDKGYKNGVYVLFWRDLRILLWTLLLVIPGVIKAYEYRMVPYILSENIEMEQAEVFALSKQMMNGNKWRAFLLDLSFILWDFLGVITLGITNTFYATPYKQLTEAGLYRALKG